MARVCTRITASCVLLLFLECATSSPLFLKEGDACPDASTCRPVRHCGSAMLDIQQRRPLPQRCGFVGLEELFCCPDNSPDVADREVDASDRELASDRGRARSSDSSDIPTSDDSSYPANQRPSVTACSSYKDKRGLEDYIRAGKFAGQREFPHMAALAYNLQGTEGLSWLCAGTLISDKFVLTAAHCCANRIVGRPVKVRLGVNNLTATADATDYEISDIIMHPNYRKRQYNNDIALLKLDRKVEFSDAIFPACLNTLDGDPRSFTAAGWGATNAAGTRLSSALMKTTIYPYALPDCQNAYKEKFPNGMDSSVICAGDPQGKTGTCTGDGGSPLVTGRSAPYTAVGITSLGPIPCGGIIPSIYTRVSSYLDWIEKHVWP